MRLQKLVAVFGLCALMGATLMHAQDVSVTVTLFSDNGYALFYTDPASGNLVRAGFRGGSAQSDWRIIDTYTFTAPLNSYLYVIAHDTGIAAHFAAKVVFSNTLIVYTGVGNNWEVNSLYRTDLSASNPFRGTDSVTQPATVSDWLTRSNEWEQPAVGGVVGFNQAGEGAPFDNTAKYIWKSPGGGQFWGFNGYTGPGTALFRLQVVPEPASLLALGAGLAGLLGLKRRNKR